MSTAPILLFTYKRLDTLKRAVAALQQNILATESDLFIFSDAAKKQADQQAVKEVRAFLRTVTGFKKVTIVEREQNWGLAKSIIAGTSSVLESYEQAIVLEDDLIATPNFLVFMNAALHRYEKEKKVFSISGYSFNLSGGKQQYAHDAYFLNRGWSWGWATWKDRWKDVDWEVSTYNAFVSDSKAQKTFAQGGSDLNKMLREQMEGRLDSWAIRWFYHQFRIDGLTLYPVFSKIYNAGFDAFATHTTGSEARYIPELDTENKATFIFPADIAITGLFQQLFQKRMGIAARIKSKLQTILLKVFKAKK
ncbi:MAG: glycosyltransferase [Agriterribacter sp.]